MASVPNARANRGASPTNLADKLISMRRRAAKEERDKRIGIDAENQSADGRPSRIRGRGAMPGVDRGAAFLSSLTDPEDPKHRRRRARRKRRGTGDNGFDGDDLVKPAQGFRIKEKIPAPKRGNEAPLRVMLEDGEEIDEALFNRNAPRNRKLFDPERPDYSLSKSAAEAAATSGIAVEAFIPPEDRNRRERAPRPPGGRNRRKRRQPRNDEEREAVEEYVNDEQAAGGRALFNPDTGKMMVVRAKTQNRSDRTRPESAVSKAPSSSRSVDPRADPREGTKATPKVLSPAEKELFQELSTIETDLDATGKRLRLHTVRLSAGAEGDLFSLILNDVDIQIEFRKRYFRTCSEFLLSNYSLAHKNDLETRMWRIGVYGAIDGLRALLPLMAEPRDNKSEALSEKERLYLMYNEFLAFVKAEYIDLCSKLKKLAAKSSSASDSSVRDDHRARRAAPPIWHRCVGYLGDLERYRVMYMEVAASVAAKNWAGARALYSEANFLMSNLGLYHNQLAIVSTHLDKHFDAMYHYFRSITVKNPFMSARESLLLLFRKRRDSHSSSASEIKDWGGSSSKRFMRERAKQSQMEPDGLLAELCKNVVLLHGMLYTKISIELYEDNFRSFSSMLGTALSQRASVLRLPSSELNEEVHRFWFRLIMSGISSYVLRFHATSPTSSSPEGDEAEAELKQRQFTLFMHVADVIVREQAKHLDTRDSEGKDDEADEFQLDAGLTYVELLLEWLVCSRFEILDGEGVQRYASFWSSLCILCNFLAMKYRIYPTQPSSVTPEMTTEQVAIESLRQCVASTSMNRNWLVRGFLPLREGYSSAVYERELIASASAPGKEKDAWDAKLEQLRETEPEVRVYGENGGDVAIRRLVGVAGVIGMMSSFFVFNQETKKFEYHKTKPNASLIARAPNYNTYKDDDEQIGYNGARRSSFASQAGGDDDGEEEELDYREIVRGTAFEEPEAGELGPEEDFDEDEDDYRSESDDENLRMRLKGGRGRATVFDEDSDEEYVSDEDASEYEDDEEEELSEEENHMDNLKKRREELLVAAGSSGAARGSTPSDIPSLNVKPGADGTVLVFDTNCYVGNWEFVKLVIESGKWIVVLPLIVLTEIDGLRAREDETGRTAREALAFLHSYFRKPATQRWLKLQTSSGNYLNDMSVRVEAFDGKPDDIVLKVVLWQHRNAGLSPKNKNRAEGIVPVVLVSEDVNLRLKGSVAGVEATGVKDIRRIIAKR